MGWSNPVTVIVVSGFGGGLVVALAIFFLQRRGQPSHDPFSGEPVTDIINMSRLRVAGVGGLGLVAMAIAVALDIPRIGQSLSAGLVLGGLAAAIVIFWRSRTGPLPSSGERMGANTTLGIDSTPSAKFNDVA